MPQAGAIVTHERCVTGGPVAASYPGIFPKKKME
jgi:hypothetical protein